MNPNDKVFEALKASAEPLKSGEIADRTGIDKITVDKAIKVLVKEGKLESPKRCFYSVKK